MASKTLIKDKENKVVAVRLRFYRGCDGNGKQLKPFTKNIKIPPEITKVQLEKFIIKEANAFDNECKATPSVDRNIRFQDFAKEVMNIKKLAGKEESTLSRYQNMLDTRLNAHFGHMKICDITGGHLNKYYGELLSDGQNKHTGGALSSKTVLEYHRLLSTIFNEAKKQHIISFNPAEDVTPPKSHKKAPNYYQPDELQKIMAAFENEPIKWRLMVLLMATYGDRRSEFAGIRIKNIDFRRHEFSLQGAVLYTPRLGVYAKDYSKNEHYNSLPMTPQVESLMQEYLAWREDRATRLGDMWKNSDYLFNGQNGGMINPDTITKYFARVSKHNQKADPSFPQINPHAFRHTVVSNLLYSGVDIVTVANYVGDKPETISQHYAHIVNKGKINAANVMCGVLKADT